MEKNVHLLMLEHARDMPIPTYATEGSAGLDLRAAIVGPRIIPPGDRCLIPTGISIQMTPDMKGDVRSRSGLAVRYGVVAFNGVIDSDFRGEISVLLFNTALDKPFTVSRGQRIAQLVFSPINKIKFELVQNLNDTKRGVGGFGSTGSV